MTDTQGAEPVDGTAQMMGEGELPADLDRVNWGAFAFAFIWIFRWGPRSWRNVLIGTLVFFVLVDEVALLFFDSNTVYPVVASVTANLPLIVWPSLAALYGVSVNRALWRREQVRLQTDASFASRSIGLDRFRNSTRFWTRLFVVFLVLNVALALYVFSVPPVDWRSLIPAPIMVAALILFAYDQLHRRRRAS